jgi:hypothetical protein
MFRRKRMDLAPRRIKDINGLHRVLDKAKQLGGEV